MPKKAGYLNTIGKMFRVALVKLFADRQPHVNEDEHTAEHMHAMQTSDREIAGKVRAMLRQEHRSVLDVFLLDLGNLLGRRHIEKVRSVHCRIDRIGVHWLKRNLVVLQVGVVQRRPIVQMTSDLEERRKSYRG